MKNNKEIGSESSRSSLLPFPCNSLSKTVRKLFPRPEDPPCSLFLTIPYNKKQEGNCSRELRILPLHFPYSSLLRTILPGAPDPPGLFSLQFLIRKIKDISSRELRIPQVHFPCNSLLKAIRISPPRNSRSSRSIFLTIPY